MKGYGAKGYCVKLACSGVAIRTHGGIAFATIEDELKGYKERLDQYAMQKISIATQQQQNI
ncbi:hypothetical protein QS257_12825 [Terrilactibacillus sp. S3-3]|nr:hypothetical protein QS257_12825 [Terrilactibacillus sp. S3-3]